MKLPATLLDDKGDNEMTQPGGSHEYRRGN
jgi:hypothetical protein